MARMPSWTIGAILALACGDETGAMVSSAARQTASGSVILLTTQSGSEAVVTGEGEPIAHGLCGYEGLFSVPAQLQGEPCAGCTPGRAPALITGPVPRGRHALTVLGYCSPYNVYRIDF